MDDAGLEHHLQRGCGQAMAPLPREELLGVVGRCSVWVTTSEWGWLGLLGTLAHLTKACRLSCLGDPLLSSREQSFADEALCELTPGQQPPYLGHFPPCTHHQPCVQSSAAGCSQQQFVCFLQRPGREKKMFKSPEPVCASCPNYLSCSSGELSIAQLLPSLGQDEAVGSCW